MIGTLAVQRNDHVIAGDIDGQHVTDLQKPWRQIRKDAGLEDVRIHDLRHTYASNALAQGLSLPMVGKLFGQTQRPGRSSPQPHKAKMRRIVALSRANPITHHQLLYSLPWRAWTNVGS